MKKIQSLNGSWQWQSLTEETWHPGSVPGTLISDMLAEGLLEDPYYRCNEYAVREKMAGDYLYRREFQVTLADLAADRVELVCHGLDTIAQISINGQRVAAVNDMHRRYCFPVKEYLRPGANQIEILFCSPVAFVRNEDAQNDIFYASTGCMPGNAALRKAHYMFGWDWGPQLPDMGIFRNIELVYSRAARFEDVHLRQFHQADQRVFLTVAAQTVAWGTEPECLALELEVFGPDGNSLGRQKMAGKEDPYIINDPLLWWPNGLGEQPLYTARATLLSSQGDCLDEYCCRLGLRWVTVSTQANAYGHEFALTVNGVKLFAMGANYIPEDNLLSRVSEARTRRLVRDCAGANFNCLRVWGGGYYPDDYFYDACDEAGILVWQDLMFGCNIYALNDDFEQNIIAETKDNVRRLRHHACLALWCGNNEMEWGWADEWKRLKGHHPRYKADYTKIFEYILPRALRACDDTTFFWPSSPSSGGAFDGPNDLSRGDQHYWEVWHSGKPFTDYGDFSFCSEYGFQSFPHMKTIKAFTVGEDRNVFSRVMESHQKNGTANGKILTYVADYFLYPKNLDSLAYISQILQLKAIEYGVGHWRRKRGQCMGSLYWQLNDCWPAASWSSIDYYGRWKALHYGARRFYSPFTISISEHEELSPRLSYYVHNDTMKKRCGRVQMLLMDSSFAVLWQAEKPIEIMPLSVFACMDMDFTRWLEDEERRCSLYSVFRLFDGERLLAERTILFVKPKHFRYPKPVYHTVITGREKDYAIKVSSTAFSQYTELYFNDYDPVFSDNFFDLTSAAGVTVTVAKDAFPPGITAAELMQNLVIRSVADSYCDDGSEEE